MKMFLITRDDARRVDLHELLERAGWGAFAAEEYPVFREHRGPEEAVVTYEEVPALGVRVVGVRGPTPAGLPQWGGLVALDALGPDGGPLGAAWKLDALRARLDLSFDEEQLAPLLEVACGEDARRAAVVLRTVTTVAYMEPLLRAVVERFGPDTDRGRYARTMLDHIAPDDPAVIARRRAASVPRLELLLALHEAFHGGDGLLTEALASRLVDEGVATAEVLAMRGEARRHAGETWRAAIDLLFARHDAAQAVDPEREPDWVGPALDALHPVLASGRAGPLPVSALDLLMDRVFVGLPCLKDLLPIAGDAAGAVASRLALLALRDRDLALARQAAERALAERPDDVTTYAVGAVALGRERAATEPDALDRLEEAWRRLLQGPIDDVDGALYELAEGSDTISACLSKGLGCPVGSILVGDQTTIDRARHKRKMLGGGMRQAGIIAAAALHAFDHHHVDRLAEDHRRASQLAEELAALPIFDFDPASVETNLVYAKLTENALDAQGDAFVWQQLLETVGVRCYAESRTTLRFVTHLDLNDELVAEAPERLKPLCA